MDYVKINIPRTLVSRVQNLTLDMKNEKPSVVIRTALKRYCEVRELEELRAVNHG